MRTLVAAVALLLCTPSAAHAASMWWQEPLGHDRGALHVRADAGERNAITVQEDGQFGVLIRDTGAPLEWSEPCRASSEHEVRCPRAYFEVDLGDGDDAIDLGRFRGSVSGGAGDDRIRGSGGADYLLGGDGADTIEGGPGDDQVSGDEGHDRLSGGPGADEIRYYAHPRGVLVSLGQAPIAVGDGQEDFADGFESVYGTSFDDVFVGDDGPNVMDGDEGATRIDARGGNDAVTVAGGSVRLGAGDDSLFGGPHTSVDCGSGVDVISGRRFLDLLQPNCETWAMRLRPYDLIVPVPIAPKVVGRTAFVRFGCPRGPKPASCAGTVVLDRFGDPPREIGRRAVTAQRGQAVSAVFRLTRAELDVGRGRSGLPVCVQMRLDYRRDPRPREWDGYCTILRAR
jgi:Ca2+-binding RTX toxin-like protein